MADDSFGDGSLFKEIGNTLESVGNEVLLGTVSSLKTAVARRVVATQEGNVVAQQATFMAWLPFVILGLILFLILRK